MWKTQSPVPRCDPTGTVGPTSRQPAASNAAQSARHPDLMDLERPIRSTPSGAGDGSRRVAGAPSLRKNEEAVWLLEGNHLHTIALEHPHVRGTPHRRETHSGSGVNTSAVLRARRMRPACLAAARESRIQSDR